MYYIFLFFAEYSSQFIEPSKMTRQPINDISVQPSIAFSVPTDWTSQEVTISIEYMLYCCDDSGVCMMKQLVFEQPMTCTGDDTSSDLTRNITHCIGK